MATVAAPRRRLGRLERSALAGVLVRELVNYSSYWRASAFSSGEAHSTALLNTVEQ